MRYNRNSVFILNRGCQSNSTWTLPYYLFTNRTIFHFLKNNLLRVCGNIDIFRFIFYKIFNSFINTISIFPLKGGNTSNEKAVFLRFFIISITFMDSNFVMYDDCFRFLNILYSLYYANLFKFHEKNNQYIKQYFLVVMYKNN